MTSLRHPIPTVAFLSLGLVACNDEAIPFGGLHDTGDAGTGAGGDTGLVRDTGSGDSGSDTGSDDTGSDDTGSDDTGSDSGPDDTGSDAGGFDTGSDSGGFDSGSDTGDVEPGTVTLEELAEVALNLCIREGQCDGETGYREECEQYVERYAAEYLGYINALGEDCARAYLGYLDCVADNGECRTDEDGYSYLDPGTDCADEYARANSVCEFDEYDYDGGPPPIPEP